MTKCFCELRRTLVTRPHRKFMAVIKVPSIPPDHLVTGRSSLTLCEGISSFVTGIARYSTKFGRSYNIDIVEKFMDNPEITRFDNTLPSEFSFYLIRPRPWLCLCLCPRWPSFALAFCLCKFEILWDYVSRARTIQMNRWISVAGWGGRRSKGSPRAKEHRFCYSSHWLLLSAPLESWTLGSGHVVIESRSTFLGCHVIALCLFKLNSHLSNQFPTTLRNKYLFTCRKTIYNLYYSIQFIRY